ncbi:recombinase family protein [Nocardioides sp. NPDC051685]|uniref:recombinase family protein n=1 Tax=Nocardioides sp. NPDC051685 TaxID=3364334 RepID=UPI00379B5DE2
MNTATQERPVAVQADMEWLAALMATNRDLINTITMTEPTRLVTYSRISDTSHAEDGEGVGEQRDDSILYAERHYPDAVIVGHYIDDDTSAYKETVVREDFDRMLRDAKAGAFDGVIVRDSDRLYRRLDELPRITKQLVPYARVIARHEGEVDLTTAAGIMMAQIKGAVAEHSSRRQAERIRDNARHRAQGGRMTSSTRPFAWAWREPCDAGEGCRHKGRPCKACKAAKRSKDCEHKTWHAPGELPLIGSRQGLVPHPVEGPLLAKAYDMVAEGGELRTVGRWLASQGARGVGGGVFRPDSLLYMLRSPRHAGLVAHGRYTEEEAKKVGKRPGEWRVVAESASGHRIVDVDLWQQVQTVLDASAKRKTPGRPANNFLTGIAKCGRVICETCAKDEPDRRHHGGGDPDSQVEAEQPHTYEPMVCGAPMVAGTKHNTRASGEKVKSPTYQCSRYVHTRKGRADVDNYVLDAVGVYVIEHAEMLAAKATVGPGAAEQLAAREVDRLGEQIKSYQGLATDFDPADLAAILADLRAKQTEAKRKAVVIAPRPAVAALVASGNVPAAWDALVEDEDRDPVRTVLRELLDEVTIRPTGRRGTPVDQSVEIMWGSWVNAS